MFDEEMQSVQDLFEEELELAVWDVKSHATYKIVSYDGIEPNNTLLVSYYYDQSTFPFADRTPNYTGKLTVMDKGSHDNYNRYGVYASGTYKFFSDAASAEEYGGYVEGEDLVSLRDILAWGYMCTYPNGNSVGYAVNDEDESYERADEALGIDQN